MPARGHTSHTHLVPVDCHHVDGDLDELRAQLEGLLFDGTAVRGDVRARDGVNQESLVDLTRLHHDSSTELLEASVSPSRAR